ncbi:winged helix-turn-helix transcriptional regulator [Arenibacterium sp. LLYu02]|uniref:winged helix-turn-helix transcriptional regulator n=1 Tax=Arenibacterium sp. LLYu02 TaxID=3404132 RepID=UPI003B2127CE
MSKNASTQEIETPGSEAELDRLVTQIIGRVADKWTMYLIDILHEEGPSRFGELGRHCEGISQKMLTQTLRAMEREGLVHREVYPVVPPKVVYSLTDLGSGLGAAFCGVWKWAAENRTRIEAARRDYSRRHGE